MSRRGLITSILAFLLFSGLVIWGVAEGWFRELFMWMAPFAPFSTAFVAAVAGVIAWRTYVHRRKIDNRAEWWRRVQSAIDLATTDADQIGRKTGLTLLSHLSEDPDITSRDLELIRDVAEALMDEVLLEEKTRSTEEVENEATPSYRWLPRIRGILRVRRVGRR